MAELKGLNPGLYEKLAEELEVMPLVLEFEDCDRSGCYFRRRWSIIPTLLLEGKLCKENLRTVKAILKSPHQDGYILIDPRVPKTYYDLALAHEFAHAYMRKKRKRSKLNDTHTLDELEADVISTVILIKNKLDPIKSISDYKSYLASIPKMERFFTLAPLWRLVGFVVLLSIIKMIW